MCWPDDERCNVDMPCSALQMHTLVLIFIGSFCNTIQAFAGEGCIPNCNSPRDGIFICIRGKRSYECKQCSPNN